MQDTERALAALSEFEEVKDGAIKELLNARKEIDEKLARLGHDGKSKASRKSKCGTCGSAEHTARFHKKGESHEVRQTA